MTIEELMNPPIARDCAELKNKWGSNESGTYTITLNPSRRMNVYCDQITKNGGWIVSIFVSLNFLVAYRRVIKTHFANCPETAI